MRTRITLKEAGDVLTTALEGGIGYWSAAAKIDRDEELTVRSVELHPNDDPESDFEPKVVTRQMVRDTWAKLARQVAAGGLPFRRDLVQQMHDETIEPGDAGGVDADVSDCIVQIAMFGEVVYG